MRKDDRLFGVHQRRIRARIRDIPSDLDVHLDDAIHYTRASDSSAQLIWERTGTPPHDLFTMYDDRLVEANYWLARRARGYASQRSTRHTARWHQELCTYYYAHSTQQWATVWRIHAGCNLSNGYPYVVYDLTFREL